MSDQSEAANLAARQTLGGLVDPPARQATITPCFPPAVFAHLLAMGWTIVTGDLHSSPTLVLRSPEGWVPTKWYLAPGVDAMGQLTLEESIEANAVYARAGMEALKAYVTSVGRDWRPLDQEEIALAARHLAAGYVGWDRRKTEGYWNMPTLQSPPPDRGPRSNS